MFSQVLRQHSVRREPARFNGRSGDCRASINEWLRLSQGVCLALITGRVYPDTAAAESRFSSDFRQPIWAMSPLLSPAMSPPVNYDMNTRAVRPTSGA